MGNYRSTDLYYEMLCEPISSDNEEKQGFKLSGNCLINPQNLTTIIEENLVLQQCVKKNYLHMKLKK